MAYRKARVDTGLRKVKGDRRTELVEGLSEQKS